MELLLERGCKHVVAFDLAPPSPTLQARFDDSQQRTGNKITVLSGNDGDLTSDDAVTKAFTLLDQPFDVCFHIGALVGPFFDRELYHAVNHYGTIRIIEHCRKYNCHKLVYSSSPSTRFTGHDICNQREDQLPMPTKWLAMYAEAKAYGEVAVSKAHDKDSLRTVSVAPHQVYGPHDGLMLPKLLETAGSGRLRIFGNGFNRISVCFVDNYCHGLICGADALESRPDIVGGKFYIVTDGDDVFFWKWLNQAVVAMGFTDLWSKMHLSVWFLYAIAYICNGVGYLTGKKFKLNPFNVTMLTIHRYFSIDNAKQDLLYAPVKEGTLAWKETIEWFRQNWLPSYLEEQQQQQETNEATDTKTE